MSDLIADIDQAIAAAGSVAKLLGAYYIALIEEDVHPDHAILIVVSYQEMLLRGQLDDHDADAAG